MSNILIWKNQNDTTTRELYTSLGYSGGIPRFERIPRYHDLQFKFLSKMDSVANSGYITHGYFNMHGFSKIDTIATLATKYWVTHTPKTYFGNQTILGDVTISGQINASNFGVIGSGNYTIVSTDLTHASALESLGLTIYDTNPSMNLGSTTYNRNHIIYSNGTYAQTVAFTPPTTASTNIIFPNASGIVALLGGSGGALPVNDTVALKRKSDSVSNSGYVTHGFYNRYAISKIDTASLLATRYWVTHNNNDYYGNLTFNTPSGGGINTTNISGNGIDLNVDGTGGFIVRNRTDPTKYVQLLPGTFQSTNSNAQTQYYTDYIRRVMTADDHDFILTFPATTTSIHTNINLPDASGTVALIGDIDNTKKQILTGNNTYSGNNAFTGTRFFGSEFHGGQHLDTEDYQGLSQYSPNARLRFSSAYTAGNDGYLYHGDEINYFNDPWLVLQIKNAGYKFFRDSLTRISDSKKVLFQGDAPSVADTVPFARKIGNANMVQNTYKGRTSVSTDHSIQGDSTQIRTFNYMGSSFTLGPPQALLISDTSTFAYKTTRIMGGIENNMGVGSRTLQQITVGDNSLYSNIAAIPQYTPGSVLIIEPQVNDVVGDTTKYTTALHTTQLTAYVNYAISSKGWPANPQHIVIFNPFYYNFTAQANHGSIPYRHSIYNTAEQGVATSLGVGFLDLYSTEPHQYVYQDSLHSNGLGHTWAAGQLATYLTSQSIPIYSYNVVKNKTVGNATVYGDQTVNGALNVSGPISAINIKTPQINVDFLTTNKPVNFLNAQNDNNNRNLNWGGNNGSPSITANTNKGGAIYGYAYADGNLSPTLRMLSYTSSSTANTLLIGSSLGGQGNLSALDIYGNEVGSTAVKRALFGYLNTGDWILGGGGADVARFTVNQPTTGNGTITVTATGTGIVGTATLFTNTFKVGQTITANGETHTITAITNNTNMTTDAWTNAFTGTYTLVGGNRLQVFGSGNITTAGFGLGLLHLSAAGVWSSSLVAGGDLSTTIALPSGATATTQTAGTNNTSLATMAALFAERSNAFTYTNKTHDMLRLTAGANGGKGTATLVAGTVTVANTAVTASTIIIPIRQTNGGTLGTLSYTVSAGTGFTITSSSSTDTSVIAYLVIN